MAKKLQKDRFGGITNQYGVRLTEKEQKELKYLTDKANKNRRELIKSSSDKFLEFHGYRPQGDEAVNRIGVGDMSVMKNRSKSLHQFKSKEDFKKHMSKLKTVTDKNYMNKKVDIYRENYIRKLKEVHGRGKSGKDGKFKPNVRQPKELEKFIKTLRSMSHHDYISMVQTNPLFEINYHYTDSFTEYDPSEYIDELNDELNYMLRR